MRNPTYDKLQLSLPHYDACTCVNNFVRIETLYEFLRKRIGFSTPE